MLEVLGWLGLLAAMRSEISTRLSSVMFSKRARKGGMETFVQGEGSTFTQSEDLQLGRPLLFRRWMV